MRLRVPHTLHVPIGTVHPCRHRRLHLNDAIPIASSGLLLLQPESLGTERGLLGTDPPPDLTLEPKFGG